MARRLQGKDPDVYDVEADPKPEAPHPPDQLAPPPEDDDENGEEDK
jgi:hypothetical protein